MIYMECDVICNDTYKIYQQVGITDLLLDKSLFFSLKVNKVTYFLDPSLTGTLFIWSLIG